MGIEDIYQQTLLDYSRRKEHCHTMEDATGVERGHNPSCGDDITLFIKEKNGIVEDVSFSGIGCAVSTASTNMLIECIKGKPFEYARKCVELFFKMMAKEPLTKTELDILTDAQILGYFSGMPARIKCATLSWHSAKVLIAGK
ncbi:MAG: Fe-S cluster assembly sulfur transfer protein SufU [Treponema sp.]